MIQIAGLECYLGGGRTGKPDCILNPKLFNGGFAIPKNSTNGIITATNMADFEAFLLARCIDSNPNNRWIYLGPFESCDDKSDAPSQQTLGFGRKRFTDKGFYAHEWTYIDGGLYYHEQLMAALDGKESLYKIAYFDADNNFMGTQTTDTDGNMACGGLSVSQFFFYPWKVGNKATEAEYRVSVALKNQAEFNVNYFVIAAGFDIKSMMEGINGGVQDVELTDITPGGNATGVFTIAAASAGGNVNLAATLGTVLDSTTAFVATNAAGLAIPVTAVAVNAANTGYTITLDHTSANYSATAKANITMAAVSVLAGLGAKYYESDTVQVTMN